MRTKDEGHWLTNGRCVKCGHSGSCPKRQRLARARALRSIYSRMRGVTEVTLVTLTTGVPGPGLLERFNALRAGVRVLAQRYGWNGISAIEWTRRPTGWHVHCHVVIVGNHFYPWERLSADAVAAGLGTVVHVAPARSSGGLFAALYAVKYVAKGVATPERTRELKGRRLWTGHGAVSAWKGSPGWKVAIEEARSRLEKENDEHVASCEIR